MPDLTKKTKTQKTLQKSSPQEYIHNWIVSFVEKPNPLLGNMPPCPYARQARIKNQIKMLWLSNAEPDSNCWTHIKNTNFDQIEVLVLIADQKRWSPQEIYKIRCELNKTFHPDDIVVLEDHPADNECVGKVFMSNGRYCLLFAQRKSKLNRFADILKETTDYYKNWTQQELDDVVTWRYQDPK